MKDHHTPIDAFRVRRDVTTIRIEGEDYAFFWVSEPVLEGDSVVGWQPRLDTVELYSHTDRKALTWSEFQERTMAFYDEQRVAALIYSKETEWDPA